jgi:hypothetical protein
MELRTQVQVSQYVYLSLLPGHSGSIVNKGVMQQVLPQGIPCQLTFKQYFTFTSVIQDMDTKLMSNSSTNSPSFIPQLLVTMSYSHIISAIYTTILMNTVR